MKTPDFAALHGLLDQLQRDYEALAAGINDPDRFAAAYEKVWYAKIALLHELIADQLAERLGVARIARYSLEITPSWLPEAGAVGRKPVAPLSVMDMDEAAAQRRMAAQFFNEFSDMLPPGLGTNMATTMTLLNLGEVLPLASPMKIQGLRSGAGRHAVAFFYFAIGLYYRVGYFGKTVEALLAENTAIIDMSRNAFDKEIRKLAIRPTVDKARSDGQADALAGKPMRPYWCGEYDLSELARIMRKSAAAGDNIIPFGSRKR